MGNQQSSGSDSRSSQKSPSTASHGTQHERSGGPPHAHAAHTYPTARRRESIPVLHVKGLAAPPSASLETAKLHTAVTRPRSRGSQTVATTTAAVAHHHLRAAQEHLRPTAHDTMGAEQSKSQSPRRDEDHVTRPSSTPPPAQSAPTSPEPAQQEPPPPPPSQPTAAVDVPAAPQEESRSHRVDNPATSIESVGASQDYAAPSSHYSRPPRLPLPIDDEDQEHHHADSPILAAHNVSSPIDPDEVEGTLPRHASMLSSTTADDEDLGDEFKGPTGRPTVPTLIEWEGEGERVYVTGTFAGWNRKYKLHRK